MLIADFDYQPITPSFAAAREKYPNIALTLKFSLDEDYMWYGDSPAPDSPAYVAEIRATKIENGVLRVGSAYLGGCYPLEDKELDFEVGGYTPQILN